MQKILDDIDKKILNIIQSEFPISKRPYLEIAKRVGISEEEAFQRVENLYKNKIIRRIGATFNSHSLGYASTLVAAKVPEDKIDKFVNVINSYPQVTHNYLREHEFNVWFTFIDRSMNEIEKKLREISQKTGVKELYNLPAKRMFKVKVDMNV